MAKVVGEEQSPFAGGDILETAEEGTDTPKGCSTSRGKRKSKPTSKDRAKRQKTKDRYAHAREDAQLEGLIPTTPEEALRPERVPPCAQSSQPLPELIAQAIRLGWATRDEVKPQLVEELVAIILNPEMPAGKKIAAFSALRQADQAQWERDHPEEAAKARGGVDVKVQISLQNNLAAIELMNKMLNDSSTGIQDITAPGDTGTPGDS